MDVPAPWSALFRANRLVRRIRRCQSGDDNPGSGRLCCCLERHSPGGETLSLREYSACGLREINRMRSCQECTRSYPQVWQCLGTRVWTPKPGPWRLRTSQRLPTWVGSDSSSNIPSGRFVVKGVGKGRSILVRIRQMSISETRARRALLRCSRKGVSGRLAESS